MKNGKIGIEKVIMPNLLLKTWRSSQWPLNCFQLSSCLRGSMYLFPSFPKQASCTGTSHLDHFGKVATSWRIQSIKNAKQITFFFFLVLFLLAIWNSGMFYPASTSISFLDTLSTILNLDVKFWLSIDSFTMLWL